MSYEVGMLYRVISDQADANSRRQLRRMALDREGGRCFWCNRRIVMKPRHGEMQASLDHIIPQSKGGWDGIDNVVISCVPCNNERGDMDAELYLVKVMGRAK